MIKTACKGGFLHYKVGDKMKSFYLNNEGDLEFDQLNNIKMVADKKEVEQRTRLSLSTNRGEWFLNLKFGIPWVKLLGQKNNQEDIRYELIKTLSQDSAIKAVDWVDFDYDYANRNLTVSFKATLIDNTSFEKTVEVN